MKTLLIVFCLGMTLVLAAQKAPEPEPGLVFTFKPLSINGQKRPIEIPKPPRVTQRNIISIIWAVLLVIILALSVFLVNRTSGFWGKIGMSILMIVISLVISLVMMMLNAYSFDPPKLSKHDIAVNDVWKMTNAMGIETPYFRIINDDDFRVAIALSENRFVFVDYQEDKGLIIPTANIDTLLDYSGLRNELPELPKNDDNNWIIETKDAQQAGDVILQQLEYRFKDVSPSRIVLRYVIAEYPAETAASLMEIMRNSPSYTRENLQ
jgi:hypothetical protein